MGLAPLFHNLDRTARIWRPDLIPAANLLSQ